MSNNWELYCCMNEYTVNLMQKYFVCTYASVCACIYVCMRGWRNG